MEKLSKIVSAFAFVLAHSLAIAADVSQPKSYHGISYVSGGIGEDERAALARVADLYNLKLEFASQQEGAYLADIKVVIRDAQGKMVLEALSDGPWFMAKLPPGEYQIEASERARPIQKSATVSGQKATRLVFLWPALGAPAR